jgi:hypothetical protein
MPISRAFSVRHSVVDRFHDKPIVQSESFKDIIRNRYFVCFKRVSSEEYYFLLVDL